jgi:5-methylcytosine-specific restriction endonuclease McrA
VEIVLTDYVTTNAWKRRRNRALEKAGWKCQKCGRQMVALFVVHRTFARVGHERPSDLAVMCGDCFKRTPIAKPTDRGRRYHALARDVFASDHFDTLPAFVDALKVRCARLRWRYDADRLSAAVAAVWR